MGTFLTATTQKPIVMFLWYVWQFSVIQIFSSAKHSTDYVGQYEYQTNMFDQQYLRVVHWWRLSWGQLRGEYQVLEGDTSQSNYLQKCKFFKVFKTIRIQFCYFLWLTETEGRYIDTFSYQLTIPRKLKEILGVLPMVQYHQHTSPISICKH